MKEELMNLAEYIHLKFFGYTMSNTMRDFLQNLSWSFFSGVISVGIMFLLQIIVAKILGVEQFGRYNVVLSFATSISFFFLLGSDVGGVRFLADKKYKHSRRDIFTTLLIVVSFQIIIALFFLFFLKSVIIKYFNIEQTLYFLGIFWGIIIAIRSIFDGYIRSLMLIKKQSIAKFAEVLTVVVMFGVFLYLSPHRLNYQNYISIIIFGYIIFTMILIFYLRRHFGIFNIDNIKKILNYNRFVVLIAVGGFLMNMEKILIGKFIGIRELGVFSAYYLASSLILSNLGGIFSNVFLPSVIGARESIFVVLEKMNSLFKKMFFFWLLIDVIVIYVVFRFIGGDYQFSLLLAAAFAVLSYLTLIFSFLADILKIDYIKIVLPIVLISNLSMIGIIIIGGDIYLYVFGQIFIYFIACYFMRRYLIIKYREN